MNVDTIRVLVSGGAGFLGSHLCEALIDKGYFVICLDNFISGAQTNIAHLMDHPRFDLVVHDIVTPLFIDDIHYIYNLACPASPIHYQYNPVKTVKTNVIGTIHMLGMAKKTGARILQASTSEVYGDPMISPQSEAYFGNVNPFGPRSCYDEGKRTAETLFYNYHHEHGVDIRIARIFNTYGPRMAINDGRVVSNFIVHALRGEDISIYGAGSQTRSFCYVSDLIKGLIDLMECSELASPINLGNDSELSVLELARLIVQKTSSHSKIVHLDALEDDPKIRKPDLSLARSELDWAPGVNLNEGLDATIAYFREVLAG